MKSVPGRVQANQGEDIRRCAAVAVISLFIGLAAACGGDDSDYFSSVLGEAAGMQDSTNAIFGDGTNVQTCSLAAEHAASNVLAVIAMVVFDSTVGSVSTSACQARASRKSSGSVHSFSLPRPVIRKLSSRRRPLSILHSTFDILHSGHGPSGVAR